MADSSVQVTALLHSWMGGDQEALNRLIEIVYPELHEIAHRLMRNERAGHVLQTTALVNETYLRLNRLNNMTWNDSAHFRAVSARLMRRILIDIARSRPAGQQVSLPENLQILPNVSVDVIALDLAISKLAEVDERKARVLEMRYFSEMTAEETAAVLGVSVQTVNNDRILAKSWLLRELHGGNSSASHAAAT